MASKTKQMDKPESIETIQDFLESDKKLSELTRKELAIILEDLPADHWLRPELTAALRDHIVGRAVDPGKLSPL